MSFHVAKTGKMSKVTLAVFCTLLGLLPLCRAYIKRKEANAKFDVRSFGCLMSLLEALMHCSRFGHSDGSLQMDSGNGQPR